jgi:hypothetical protein
LNSLLLSSWYHQMWSLQRRAHHVFLRCASHAHSLGAAAPASVVQRVALVAPQLRGVCIRHLQRSARLMWMKVVGEDPGLGDEVDRAGGCCIHARRHDTTGVASAPCGSGVGRLTPYGFGGTVFHLWARLENALNQKPGWAGAESPRSMQWHASRSAAAAAERGGPSPARSAMHGFAEGLMAGRGYDCCGERGGGRRRRC